jgi:hypothetical protein
VYVSLNYVNKKSRQVHHKVPSSEMKNKGVCKMRLKQQTEQHKLNHIVSACEFLERFELEGEDVLSCIVTNDVTWIAHYTPEIKKQSSQ